VRVARRGRLGNGRTYWSGRDCLIGHVFGARSRSRAARHRYGYLGRTLMTWCWIKASYWVVLSNENSSWFTTKATKRPVPFLVTCYSSLGFIFVIRYPAIAGPPTATTTIAGYFVVETLDGATIVGSRRPPPPRPGGDHSEYAMTSPTKEKGARVPPPGGGRSY